MQYLFPVQDIASAAELRSVSEGLEPGVIYEDPGYRNKEISSNNDVPPYVLEVSSRYSPSTTSFDKSTSADGLRTEPRSKHTAKGKISRGKSYRRHSPNFKDNIVI
jgi:hypothetical protein